VHADAVVITGDARCAREVALEAASSGFRPTLVLALEGAEAREGLLGLPAVGIGAGRFPLGLSPEEGSGRAALPHFRSAPTWYAALGRDAALLAAGALAELPAEDVDDAAAVERRHEKAREALGRVRAPLWTTDARGFEGKLVVERVLVASEVPRGADEAP
jgi:hypothetical protein